MLFCCATLVAQETITASIMHDGMNRSYILYVPSVYEDGQSPPLVFNFHGFGSNATEQMFYGDFRSIAEEHGFLVVHPEGTLLNGTTTHWNVGSFTLGSTADDVGFTSALIDTLAEQYNINLDRVYSTGMSNGGYMSFLLACQLSDRIAAVASVTGSMTPETYNQCMPSHETPVMQIHGTADNVVPYDGAVWTRSIDDVLAYWHDFNSSPPESIIIPVEDRDPNDGTRSTLRISRNANDIEVQHYRVENRGHTWPGSAINVGVTSQDFSASENIWAFFDRYDINGVREITSTEEIIPSLLSIYPNPVDDLLMLSESSQGTVSIYDVKGSLVIQEQSFPINVSALQAGVYYLITEQNEVLSFIKL